MSSRDEELRRAVESLADRTGVSEMESSGRRHLNAVLQRARVRRKWRSAALAVVTSLSLAVAGLLFVEVQDRSHRAKSPRNNAAAPALETGPYTDRFYVVDPINYSTTSHILAVAPETGEIVRSYDAGYDPALALSPDGQTLYVASADPGAREPGQNAEGLKDTLVEINSQSDLVSEETDLSSRVLHTGMASTPTMVVSPDGRWVYFDQVGNGSEGDRQFSVGTYDTELDEVLPESANVDQCGESLLSPVADRELAVLCIGSNDLRIVEISHDGSAGSTRVVAIPEVPDDSTDENGNLLDLGTVAGGVLTPDGSTFYAVTQNGKVFVVDVAGAEITSSHQLDIPRAHAVDLGKVLLSPDGAQLIVGLGRFEDYDANSDEIMVAGTADWERQGLAETSAPLWTIAIGPGGDQVWAISRDSASILVIDLSSLEETGTFSDIGETPELGEAPLLSRMP